MSDNAFRNRPVYSRDASAIMRDINRVEASLNAEGNDHIDIAIVIDTSISMGSVIIAIGQNVRLVFQGVIAHAPNARIGLIEQGDWYKPSVYRCQPTDNLELFQAAIDALGRCSGSEEAYADSLILAAEETQWRTGATRLVIIIGDEAADQVSRSGNTWSQAIALAAAQGVIVSMIFARSSAEYECRASYEQATSATGGTLLTAPRDEDVVDMIILTIGCFSYEQTVFFAYLDAGKSPLGVPDGGVAVPADNALADTPFTPNPLADMRAAILGVVNTNRLKSPAGNVFNWKAGSPDNLYFIAMGDRSAYGAIGGPRYTWTRTLAQMANTPPYDLDIGEVYECVRVLKTAAGV